MDTFRYISGKKPARKQAKERRKNEKDFKRRGGREKLLPKVRSTDNSH